MQTRFRFSRAAIALAVAYVFALQAFLGGVLGAQANALGVNPYVICYGNGNASGDDGSEPSKTNHDLCALLCAQAAGTNAVLPAGEAIVLSLRDHSDVVRPPARAGLTLAPPPSPRLSQGPPKIA